MVSLSLSLCVCWFVQVWVRTKQVSRTISRSTRGRCRYFCLNTTSSCDAYVTAYTSTIIHSLQVYHLQSVSSLPVLLLLLRPLHCIIEMWMLVWVWRRTINWTMPTRHGTRRVARTTRYWTCWRTPIRAISIIVILLLLLVGLADEMLRSGDDDDGVCVSQHHW